MNSEHILNENKKILTVLKYNIFLHYQHEWHPRKTPYLWISFQLYFLCTKPWWQSKSKKINILLKEFVQT